MADGGLAVLDGSLLRDTTVSANPFFRSSGDGDSNEIDGTCLLSGAESVASNLLFGLRLPENLKTAALSRIGYDECSLRSLKFDRESASGMLRNFMSALADELRDDPLIVTVLDGSILRILLEDEDDFAMLAENLFTVLDTSDCGKLRKNEIKNALIRMGVEMGVPPPRSTQAFAELQDAMLMVYRDASLMNLSEKEKQAALPWKPVCLVSGIVAAEPDLLVDALLKTHGAAGDEWLGQAQFANILQDILQDLAEALSAKRVIVIHDVKVISGSKLRKILSNEELLNDAIDRVFNNPTASELGNGSLRRIRAVVERNGSDFGLPSAKSNEALLLLYDKVFGDMDIKESQELDKEAFGDAFKKILEKTLNQLEANPIFHEPEGR